MSHQHPPVEEGAGLSDRELAVAEKFAAGMTYREIGLALFIAPTTVRTHLSAIYQKLGVRNKVSLAKHLSRNGKAMEPHLNGGVAPGESRPIVVAVIPFENLSADERWTRIADGLSADIMVDLARYRDLAVIARQTMQAYREHRSDAVSIGRELKADYLLEGTLQADGPLVRIGVHLVDARTGVDLWAARYDRPAENIFATFDSVTEHVTNVLASWYGKVANLHREVARRKPPASLKAYEYYLLGVEQTDIFTPSANRRAIELLSRATELDPGLARAWTALAFTHANDACYGFSGDAFRSVEHWKACLHRALALDPGSGTSRICLADLSAVHGEPAIAALEHQKILAEAPNDADTIALLAGSMALVVGDPNQGLELANRAIRLNPHVPWYFGMLARCHFVLRHFGDCLVALQQAPPDSPATLLFTALSHAMLNQPIDAAGMIERLMSDCPGFSVEGFARYYPITNPPALAVLRDALHRADL